LRRGRLPLPLVSRATIVSTHRRSSVAEQRAGIRTTMRPSCRYADTVFFRRVLRRTSTGTDGVGTEVPSGRIAIALTVRWPQPPEPQGFQTVSTTGHA